MPAWFSTDSSLPDHTIYKPKNIPEGVKMPVVLWANGGCGRSGTTWMSPLIEWASNGILVIADGSPSGRGRDTSALKKRGLDRAQRNTGKGKYAMVDASRVGVSGKSCAGLVTYDLEVDRRVTTVGFSIPERLMPIKEEWFATLPSQLVAFWAVNPILPITRLVNSQ
jgi:hypothetical protein